MTAPTQTLSFQAETRELLDLMIHSLYSHREIFLRELISNSSDALDKLRFAGLTDPSLLEGDDRLRIRLEPDAAARTLTLVDNGIGMTRDEVVENIGTIARSGTKSFLKELRSAVKEDPSASEVPSLIGQFGVGFYSSFMVADRVVLETCKAGEKDGVRWSSAGDGEYTIEDAGPLPRGTRITLHLKPVDEEAEGEFKDFTQEHVLRAVVRRYSDFVEYPIEMDVTRMEAAEEGEEPAPVTKTETLNSQKPLWTRPRSEITPEEYQEFYRHVSHDWSEPLETIHFRAEGANEYTALLYVPKQRPFDLLDGQRVKSRLSLYVRRVFVMGECEELLPSWLRFVTGLVDSQDLPLNVSRETLQHNRQIGQIQKRLVKKVIDTLRDLLVRDREAYVGFWKQFGAILKEGLYVDDAHREALAEICLYPSSAGEELTTLAEYVERMPVKQKEIYTVSGPDRRSAEGSPHLEAMRSRGFEVLFLVDPIDEFASQRLTEFHKKPIRSLDRGEVDLDDETTKEAREEREKEARPMLDAIQTELEPYVSAVRFSGRLAESPAVLVSAEGGLPPHMERLLRESGQDVPPQKRILELNPDHPLLERLESLYGSKGSSGRFSETLELLYGQACLAEGSPVPDPARFAKLVTELLLVDR